MWLLHSSINWQGCAKEAPKNVQVCYLNAKFIPPLCNTTTISFDNQGQLPLQVSDSSVFLLVSWNEFKFHRQKPENKIFLESDWVSSWKVNHLDDWHLQRPLHSALFPGSGAWVKKSDDKQSHFRFYILVSGPMISVSWIHSTIYWLRIKNIYCILLGSLIFT